MKKLKFLLDYFNSNRGIGHTKTELEGINNSDDAILIVHNREFGKYLKLPDTKYLSINELEKLRGIKKPIIIDHFALEQLLNEYRSQLLNELIENKEL